MATNPLLAMPGSLIAPRALAPSAFQEKISKEVCVMRPLMILTALAMPLAACSADRLNRQAKELVGYVLTWTAPPKERMKRPTTM